MPRYLKIAEKVYKNLMDERKFSNKPVEYVNCLLREIRKEIKGTDMKLMYNFIEFNSGFKNQIIEDYMNVDVSLIPNYKHQDEFILWLAGFIEKITIGGKEKLPPLLDTIPAEFNLNTIPKDIKFL
ncbi:hypothetical protein [Acinetobacter haemolyticus]|uniref:hypothetical protein n=1 Tax=Acinetobacter haemolyticus TaxID=29430 RepID=UPI001D18BF40|nr:hypothetical protein [Acinetobacter haemolyticus]